ncbi:MAG: lipoyl synthase [Acidimicrobiales bacterium]
MPHGAGRQLRVRWLGSVPYREAWGLQRAIASRSTDDYLLLLEHPAVYTLGAHGDSSHVFVDPSDVGAELVRCDRGGDVTFHGPGQLVGYPLVTVPPGPGAGPRHVRQVEQLLIDTLVGLGMPASTVGRLEGFAGVWVGVDGTGPGGHGPGVPRKVAAIGVRVTRGRTLHGFALNVSTDLGMFAHIVPCGIPDKPVTSLLTEGLEATVGEVAAAVASMAALLWPVEIDPDDRREDSTSSGGTDQDRPTDGSAATGAFPGAAVPRDFQRVTDGWRHAVRTAPVGSGVPDHAGDDPGERSVDRRLRRAGVDPTAGIPATERKPVWLRTKVEASERYLGLRRELRALSLVTVCEEAGCPNRSECWSAGTATFMINGDRCTRACGFCQVDTRRPLPLDPAEPSRVAEAVARMGLDHAVVTCVARDDLGDGGAGAFAATIAMIRERSPGTAVEVLISDCKGDERSLSTIFEARPDVLNHNIETVARLQRAVRPSATYARSLGVLARAKDAGLTVKSGMMVGLGEEEHEVLSTLADLRAVGVDIVTIGQYLRPSEGHLPVARWWTPGEFEQLRRAGETLGFAHVQASPLTRSSYHAKDAATSTVASASVGASADVGVDGESGNPARDDRQTGPGGSSLLAGGTGLTDGDRVDAVAVVS